MYHTVPVKVFKITLQIKHTYRNQFTLYRNEATSEEEHSSYFIVHINAAQQFKIGSEEDSCVQLYLQQNIRRENVITPVGIWSGHWY